MAPSSSSGIDPGILQLFAQLDEAYSSKDFAAVRALWSRDAQRPLYIAEEHRRVMTSWEAVEDYWRQTDVLIGKLKSRYMVFDTIAVGSDLCTVAFDLRWEAWIGADPAIAGELRGTALCQREADEWRLRTYVEAPLAPITYMRDLYRLVARTEGPVTLASEGT
jgi:hypothetical protein